MVAGRAASLDLARSDKEAGIRKPATRVRIPSCQLGSACIKGSTKRIGVVPYSFKSGAGTTRNRFFIGTACILLISEVK